MAERRLSPARSAPPRAAACAARRRPGGRGRGRRRSPGSVPTRFECIASFGRDRSRPIVAAFDVDGTLTTRDVRGAVPVQDGRAPCRARAHPQSRRRARRARPPRPRSPQGRRLYRISPGWMPRLSTRQGERFARVIERRWLRPDTVSRLRRHRELGHRVVLVSASLEQYLVPFGQSLGVDGVVCTRLERNEQGLLTGRLDGANCRGPEKARRLERWLADNGLADATLWAYGDSAGDDELLARADHPVRVGKARIERRAALTARGWRCPRQRPAARRPRTLLASSAGERGCRGRATRRAEAAAGRGVRSPVGPRAAGLGSDGDDAAGRCCRPGRAPRDARAGRTRTVRRRSDRRARRRARRPRGVPSATTPTTPA